jgi:cytidylate kinase
MKKSYKDLIIAIDGHSSGGKSTFAKAIARKLQLTYVDSGAMYRAVTLYALDHGMIRDGQVVEEEFVEKLGEIGISIIYNPVTHMYETWLNGRNIEEEIRDVRVSGFVSPVSRIPAVREAMVKIQRDMAVDGGVVMDGRDIGSVVFPHADIKIFLTADPDVRAKRRYDEMTSKGIDVEYKEVRSNIMDRDHQDSTREMSPLVKPDDAVELDNSLMSLEEEMVWFDNLLREKFDTF